MTNDISQTIFPFQKKMQLKQLRFNDAARCNISLHMVHTVAGPENFPHDINKVSVRGNEILLKSGIFGRAYEYVPMGFKSILPDGLERIVIEQSEVCHHVPDTISPVNVISGGGYCCCHYDNFLQHVLIASENPLPLMDFHFPGDAIYWNKFEYDSGETWGISLSATMDILQLGWSKYVKQTASPAADRIEHFVLTDELDNSVYEESDRYRNLLVKKEVPFQLYACSYPDEALLLLDNENPRLRIFLWESAMEVISFLKISGIPRNN